jgi:hypothetical protein
MKIKQFGENKIEKWYETEDGTRHSCDENTIDKLWWVYVVQVGVGRADTDEFTIFTFGTAIDLNPTNP